MLKKDLITLRIPPKMNKWYVKEAEKREMCKSEFIRKVLFDFKEEKEKEDGIS